MPKPYTISHDPTDTATNMTLEMTVAGRSVRGLVEMADIRAGGTSVGAAEVISYTGMGMTDEIFRAAVRGSAATTDGKITWTKLNGETVAFLVAKSLAGVEYRRGEVIVAVVAKTIKIATSLTLALMSVTGGSAGNPATLEAGKYATRWFQPGLKYATAERWDVSDTVDMLSFAFADQGGVYIFHDPVPLSQQSDCPLEREPGVGHTAADLVAWIRSLPGLLVSEPRQVKIAGLNATELQVTLKSSWTQTCPFSNGLAAVPLFYRSQGIGGWWAAGTEKMQLDIFDVPGRGTVVVDIDAFEFSTFTYLHAPAGKILQSLTIAKPAVALP